MSHEDHKAYWLRSGDSWTKIDYSQKAETWMKPLVKGKETGLVEIPVGHFIHPHHQTWNLSNESGVELHESDGIV